MSEKPLEYYAYQHIPEDFAKNPDLVGNLLVSRVEYLMERVLADGHNPLDGDLTVTSVKLAGDPQLRFIWAMHE